MNIILIALLGPHGCTLSFSVYVPSSPRQNLSWLLKPKGGRGPNLPSDYFHCPDWAPQWSLSVLTPWWNGPLQDIGLCFQWGQERFREDVRWEGGGVSQLETDVLASSKHQAPGNTAQHKHRHGQIGCMAAVATYAAELCLRSSWVDKFTWWVRKKIFQCYTNTHMHVSTQTHVCKNKSQDLSSRDLCI